ncbi:MAG: hypothetical protein JW719_03315, partial [Pirellulales bacterium]|nr:hypothetical protein [Pirellulales bacterium]
GPVAFLDGEGMTYYVAVASKARFSAAFAYSAETGDMLQPLLRVESVNSVVRIAEDNVGDLDGDGVGDTNASGVAGSPMYNLFPDPEATELSLHIDDYHLSDVVMYVCVGSDIYTFNPFTGEYYYDLTAGNAMPHQPDTNTLLAGAVGGIRYDDIVMRNDGKLYSFTSLAGSAGNTGRYRQISTGNGSILSDVDDGIVVYVADPDDAEASIVDEVNPGVTFRAMIDVVEGGERYTYAIGGSDPAAQLMYKFDQDGNVVTPSADDATPTSVLPWRQITGATGFITGLDFCSGTLYGVTDQGMMYSIEGYDSTPIDISFVDEDGDGLPPAWTPGGGSNWVLDLTAASTIFDLTAAFSAAAPIAFSGLTIGPSNVEFRAYAETFFATDNAGNLYAFDVDGNPDPVFIDGLSMIPIGITNPFGVVDPIAGATGIAFSTLDYNLWHVSASRYTDEGHTVTVAPDDTRLLMSEDVDFSSYGYYSYWFGLENSNYYAHPDSNNYLDDNAEVISTYDLPGGAHGVLTTDKFSLAGYEAADRPVLTFDYYLETDGGIGTDVVTDTARVYISNDGANWVLLATNIDTPRDVMSDSDDVAPALMQDGTGGWLQLSVDLSDYVGRDNLRLKFEFSSAGSTSMSDVLGDNLYTGAYLRATAGGELVDGDSLIVMSDGSVFGEPSIFEFDMGYSLAVPNAAGAAILDGETLTITEDLGGVVTFEFVKDGALNDPANLPIYISDADSAFEVANLIAKAFNDYYFLANPDAVLEVATVVDTRVYLSRIDVNNAGLAIADPASTDTQNVVRHGAVDVTQGIAPGAAEPAIVLEGNAPGQFNNPDASVLVAVDGAMSAKAVAYQFSRAMDTYYGDLAGGTDDGTDINSDILTSVKWNEDLIYVLKHVVVDPGKFSYSNLMMGEEVAAGRAGGNGTQFYHNTQAQDNAYEGWYIDNVTIGFVERGQMVTNAMPDTRFGTLDPQDVVGLITTG